MWGSQWPTNRHHTTIMSWLLYIVITVRCCEWLWAYFEVRFILTILLTCHNNNTLLYEPFLTVYTSYLLIILLTWRRNPVRSQCQHTWLHLEFAPTSRVLNLLQHWTQCAWCKCTMASVVKIPSVHAYSNNLNIYDESEEYTVSEPHNPKRLYAHHDGHDYSPDSEPREDAKYRDCRHSQDCGWCGKIITEKWNEHWLWLVQLTLCSLFVAHAVQILVTMI